MADTKIEWADKSWNPVTGCSPVSEGCTHCYARRMAHRLAGRYGYPEAPHEFDVTLHPERLEEPLHWRKRTRIFVVSMGDLFNDEVPAPYIEQVFKVMVRARQHTFIVLTKRPERMAWYMEDWPQLAECSPHIWGLVTVEDQRRADERIPPLLQTPFAVRGVSYEPALGPVDFTEYLREVPICSHCGAQDYQCLSYEPCDYAYHRLPGPIRPALNWIIAGGETGLGARPSHPDWFRDVIYQGRTAGVPVFIKQLGARYTKQIEAWPEDLRVREFPQGHSCS